MTRYPRVSGARMLGFARKCSPQSVFLARTLSSSGRQFGIFFTPGPHDTRYLRLVGFAVGVYRHAGEVEELHKAPRGLALDPRCPRRLECGSADLRGVSELFELLSPRHGSGCGDK